MTNSKYCFLSFTVREKQTPGNLNWSWIFVHQVEDGMHKPVNLSKSHSRSTSCSLEQCCCHPAVLDTNHRAFLLCLYNAADISSSCQGSLELCHLMHQSPACICPVQGLLQTWFLDRYVPSCRVYVVIIRPLPMCQIHVGICTTFVWGRIPVAWTFDELWL